MKKEIKEALVAEFLMLGPEDTFYYLNAPYIADIVQRRLHGVKMEAV
jgi:hypothetical protein